VTLPLASYVDPLLLEAERRRLQGVTAAYAGHRAWIPEPGDYVTLPFDDGLVLLNDDGRPALLDNVCAHRQAVILDGRGRVGRAITCPVHRWSYRLDGSLRRAPGMDESRCSGLRNHELWDWQGLLFRGPAGARDTLADLDEWALGDHFAFDGYRLHHTTSELYDFDWKIFIEVYLDLYHVRPFHPGLGRFVDCDAVSWAFGEHWSCQIAPFGSLRGGTPAFQRWCELLAARPGPEPRYGALWLTLYPNTTVEVYPDTLVVSTIWPAGPERSLNVVEHYYAASLGDDLERFAKAQQVAYEETAVEDAEICSRMHRGKRALAGRGLDAVGPDHELLEAGIGHFHDWVRRHLLD
jgi:phenylpropionate dioxygenase-like ring-hydroxylating dioxygenase large terminal subunit